jgi:hypothetical protein
LGQISWGSFTANWDWSDWFGFSLVLAITAFLIVVIRATASGVPPLELLGRISDVIRAILRVKPN